MAEDFWNYVTKAANVLEHERNLRGMTRATCTHCDGKGNKEPGGIDYDAHGSYYVSPVPCRYCSYSKMEVDCSPATEAKAIEREIAKLQQRIKDLKVRQRKLKT